MYPWTICRPPKMRSFACFTFLGNVHSKMPDFAPYMTSKGVGQCLPKKTVETDLRSYIWSSMSLFCLLISLKWEKLIFLKICVHKGQICAPLWHHKGFRTQSWFVFTVNIYARHLKNQVTPTSPTRGVVSCSKFLIKAADIKTACSELTLKNGE